MKSGPLVLVSITVLTSLLVVLLLYAGANKKPNYQYASFERNFPENTLRAEDTIDLKYHGYYFAGNTHNTLYLANTAAVGHLLQVSQSLDDTIHLQLHVNQDSLRYSAIRLTVDSPYFYLADGVQKFIYQGDLESKLANSVISNVSFKTAIPIAKNSFALAVISNLKTSLAKITAERQHPTVFPHILEEQGEGIFSTDGMLTYDRCKAQLVYMYYYRNQYICMDTSLHILYRGNTIDSISQAKIKIEKIESENTYTMAAPPLTTNKRISACGGWLFIQSQLLSKNEKISAFEKASVIDVYNTTRKAYAFSFYLPEFENDRKAKDFLLAGDKLFALYGRHLIRYSMTNDLNPISPTDPL